ncbi:IS3 family transposase [Pectobacteriaceae bacterium C52]|nr:IS3 family transposase [Pectobacteriaceae bacterium C52]
MKRYSPERKAAVLAKLLPPYNMTVTALAQQEGISEATLYHWRVQAKLEGKPVPGANKTTDLWSTEARFAVIVETATLSEAELGEYCRRKGLYPEQIAQWKQDFLQTPQVDTRQSQKQAQKKIKGLERELARKEKALAEAAALLVLRKKPESVLRRGGRGRLTPAHERVQLIRWIREAMSAGARLLPACREAGLSLSTWRRWNNQAEDRRPTAERPVPANKLTAEEEHQIVTVCNEPEYASLPPAQIVPRLADKGLYLASESTFYRVLRRQGQVHHRGRSRAPLKVNKPTSYQAVGPCQVWTWDVTWLASRVRGRYFYLYLIEDIFSRKIVGYEVHEEESGERAAALLHRTVLRERCYRHPLVLHADNGAPMKSQTLKAKLEELSITGSHSRPRVSNDNPYVESLFRTLKYVPSWPSSGFLDLAEARRWVEGFSQWYNKEHRHSVIGYVTPEQRHQGEDISLLAKRKALYDMAKKARPERWSASCRQWQRVDVVMLNPDKPETGLKSAA